MADNRIQLPQSGGGIVRYFDEFKSKIEFGPWAVIGIIIAVIVIIVFFIMFYINGLSKQNKAYLEGYSQCEKEIDNKLKHISDINDRIQFIHDGFMNRESYLL